MAMGQMITKAMPYVGDVINIAAGRSEYKDSRKKGHGVVVSAGKAIGTFAWNEFYYTSFNGLGKWSIPAMLGSTLIPASVQLAGTAYQNAHQRASDFGAHKGNLGSGYFNMSEYGYTMRQRSLNAIRSNGMNLNSVLGNEARTYYRGSAD